MAVNRLRRRLIKVPMDFEHLWLRRGSLVKLAHDTMLIGQHWGRILDGELDGGGNVIRITVNEDITFEFGKNYSIDIRHPVGTAGVTQWEPGTVWEPGTQWIDTEDGRFGCVRADIKNLAGPGGLVTSVLEFVSPLPPGSAGTEDVFAFGLRDLQTLDCVVRAISSSPDLSGTVELIEYAPGIFDVDSPENIPAFDPGISSPVAPAFRTPVAPLFRVVSADESAMLETASGALIPRIFLVISTRFIESAENEDRPQAATYNFQIRESSNASQPGSGWREANVTRASFSDFFIQDVQERRYYDIRVQGVSADGRASEWASQLETFVTGKSNPPPDVASFFLQGEFLGWTMEQAPIDLLGFVIRYREDALTDFDSATPLPGSDPTNPILSAPVFIGNVPEGAQTLLIKAVDTSRNLSVNPAILSIPVRQIRAKNVVLTKSFATPAGLVQWPGLITDGTVDTAGNSSLDADAYPGGDADPFWPDLSTGDLDIFWTADGDQFWPTTTYRELIYQTSIYVPAWLQPSAAFNAAATMENGPPPRIRYRVGHRTKPISDVANFTSLFGATLGTPGAVLDPEGRDAITLTMPTDVVSPIEAQGGLQTIVGRDFWGPTRAVVLYVKVPASVFAANKWTLDEGIQIGFQEFGAANNREYFYGLRDLVPDTWTRIAVDLDHDTAGSTSGTGATPAFNPDRINVNFNLMISYAAGVKEGVSALPVDVSPIDIWAPNAFGVAPREDPIHVIDSQNDIAGLTTTGVSTLTLEGAIRYSGVASVKVQNGDASATPHTVLYPTIEPYDVTESLVVVPVYIPTAALAWLDLDDGLEIELHSGSGNMKAYKFGTVDVTPDAWTEIEISPETDVASTLMGTFDPTALDQVAVRYNTGTGPVTNNLFYLDGAFRRYFTSAGFTDFPGRIENAQNDLHEFLITSTHTPQVQTRIEDFDVDLDVVDLEEIVEVTVSGGDARLVLVNRYQSIAEVFVEITGSTPGTALVVDEDVLRGPRIQTYNSSWALTALPIRARVRGY
jgi:hypothetical protein